MHDQPYLPSLVAKRNQINRLNAEAARALGGYARSFMPTI